MLFESFIDALGKLKRIVNQSAEIPVGDKVATLLQYQALVFIDTHKGATAREIAHGLSLSSSAVTQLIDRLYVLGSVRREQDEKDRRLVHHYLTKDGEKHLSSLRRKHNERIKNIATFLSEDDLTQLVTLLEKLITNIDKNQKQIV